MKFKRVHDTRLNNRIRKIDREHLIAEHFVVNKNHMRSISHSHFFIFLNLRLCSYSPSIRYSYYVL